MFFHGHAKQNVTGANSHSHSKHTESHVHFLRIRLIFSSYYSNPSTLLSQQPRLPLYLLSNALPTNQHNNSPQAHKI